MTVETLPAPAARTRLVHRIAVRCRLPTHRLRAIMDLEIHLS